MIDNRMETSKDTAVAHLQSLPCRMTQVHDFMHFTVRIEEWSY